MQTEQWVTLAAAVVAVVSLLLCALLARRTTRLGREVQGLRERAVEPPAPVPTPPAPVRPEPPTAIVTTLPERPVEPSHDHHVAPVAPTSGVLVPSHEQVRDATLGRPLVRSAVVAHGLWYALRPESRDRVRGIVRREFRRRKRTRLAAGRRAARTAPVDRASAQAWLGSSTLGSSTLGSTAPRAER